MPRKKLSEFRAKTIVHKALGLPYQGWTINVEGDIERQINNIKSDATQFVVKVDQGVKGRFKKGLVLLNVERNGLAAAIKQLSEKGYFWFIIEPMSPHQPGDERYLSLTRDRRGIMLTYNRLGGIEVESHSGSMQQVSITDDTNWSQLAIETGLAEQQLRQLVAVFEQDYMVFLEINPYTIDGQQLRLLDLAIEVDDAGAYFVHDWHDSDFRRSSSHALTSAEETVVELADKSPASFKLDVINPDGAIFLLLSGGGASIVVADEVYNQGFGKQLANYGEYSGNPNVEETYIYTSAVLKLLLHSKAPKKVLFVGGAVANFTDIANTFTGVIKAVDEVADDLKKQGIKIFVRRGGPRQEIGLSKIETALQRHGLLGAVHSPSTPLTVAVAEALKEVA